MVTQKNSLSILSRAGKINFFTDPYPHLVITEALDQAVFEELSNQFPADDIILNGREPNDTWFDYPACKVVTDDRVSPLWRQFFEYHTSKAFFDELVELAGPQLLALNPNLEKLARHRLEDFTVGMRPGGRGDPLADGADASMECQFYLNYTRQARIIRGPHVDRPSELFAALLYFRSEDDDSTGSDLEICEATTNLYPNSRAVKISTLPAEIDSTKVRKVKSANYAANTLVLFLNSAKSIHAVSPRTPTPVPRRHINFCCDVRFDLFEMKLPLALSFKKNLESMPLVWRLTKYIR